MTELLDRDDAERMGGETGPLPRFEVRTGPDGGPAAVRTATGWRAVTRTVNRWVVETDWWRAPVRREYRRCLLAGGECLELCRELDAPGWRVVRRYD